MIYLVRHGQTDKNRAGALQGRSEHPLNERGRAQAEMLGAFLRAQGVRFARVYASPLGRAQETARLIAPEAEIVTDERLTEMDYGPWEGADLKEPAPELLAFFRDFVNCPAPEGMEPLADVVARLGAFLEELRSQPPEGDVLVSTHAVAMKGALEYLTPASRGGWWSKNIGNCALYAVELADGAWTVPLEILTD